jgi:hypothetical protein
VQPSTPLGPDQVNVLLLNKKKVNVLLIKREEVEVFE